MTLRRIRTRGRTSAARRRRVATTAVALCTILWWSATASAQLDPLLFLKRVPPTVIIVVDTSLRMLEDGSGNFYDPNFYKVADDATVMGAFPNIDTATTKTYRRVYKNLQYAAIGYTADQITATAAVWDPANGLTSNAAADVAFLDPTRYAIAKSGIETAVSENAGSSYRWGLIRLRQVSPRWRSGASGVGNNCEKPVVVPASSAQAAYKDFSPCNAGILGGNYGIYAPSVTIARPSYGEATAPAGTVMVTPAANMATSVLSIVRREPNDDSGLIPAGLGGVGYEDRPINFALLDAKSAAEKAMTDDTAANRSCRNTVVVLITGGKDDGDAAYNTANNPATTAASFLTVSGGGETKRVPIHVVAIKPAADDVTELQSIATASGGLYWSATSSGDVARAINYAVQQGFARADQFDAGEASEYVPVSPIVGTVNLQGGKDVSGTGLSFTEIYKGGNTTPANADDKMLPQRSNMIVTAGFAMPGFDGAIRAFRTYVPVKDDTQSTGWKFTAAGTRLWPDLDGRPELAGKARVPADPDTRNIYTYVPNGAGGGSVVAFTTANASTLMPHMQTGTSATTESIITFVREQPLGAVIGSTPALQDVPSLDPPPDDDYGRADAATSFAGTYKDRRATIFVGANDGMIHAIDARTGYEVWAFIPYNLLPKLKTLADGQPVEQYDYFVDSSPKLAEVKLSGSWRSLLIIGQGNGGVFYQAFDVTSAGMGVTPTLDDIGAVNSMLAQYDSPDESIQFKWAFPNYSNFDPAIFQSFTVTDGTPGGVVKLYGDLSNSATTVEKTVGFSWSDPAVGALNASRSVTAVIVGSGYFPAIETSSLLQRGGTSAPQAGNVMYLLDANTGTPIGGASACTQISSGSGSGTGCVSIGDEAGDGRKNALQADPTAAGESGSYIVKKAYIGDIDGRYWRFNFDETGSISARQMVDADVPIYASSALLFVGTSDVYMFFATGSDLLPTTAPGGTGTFRLYGLKDQGDAAALTKFGVDLDTVSNTNGLATGERPSTAPSVAGDIVFYTTTNESASAPCDDFVGNLYAVTYAGGAAYDADNSGKIENNEEKVVKELAGRATAPFIVDQHLYVGTMSAGGAMVEAFGDPNDFNNGIGQVGVRILSWREIR